jgi:2-amino-4-hydroxy-6-hydroxymethyldihydropteridine diphosphokinase
MFTYLIALGSNQRHPCHGRPSQLIDAAVRDLDLSVIARSPTLLSRPIGPSIRTYANAAAVIATAMPPPELLAHLHSIEARFGRRRSGQRWRARVIDLDIILWSGGIWTSPELNIPHPAFRDRSFVLRPSAQAAPTWRDPLTSLTLRHLKARLDRKPPLA